MKKFIGKVILFLIVVATLDFCVGTILESMSARAKGGNAARAEYVFKQANEDIILMGSSRCIHHYNPFIIEDSLGMSTYNCGNDGMGIIYNYAIYTSMRERHLPKVIVYDIAPSFDLYEGTPNDKYIHGIRQFSYYGKIIDICTDIDNNDKYKLYSKCYRLNSSYLHILRDFIHPRGLFEKGFKPSVGVMDYEIKDQVYNPEAFVTDSVKIKYWNKLFELCKQDGVSLILSVSPTYSPYDHGCYDIIKNLANKNGIPFIDNYDCDGITGQKQYFSDSTHMNEDGANEFSKRIVKYLSFLIK